MSLHDDLTRIAEAQERIAEAQELRNRILEADMAERLAWRDEEAAQRRAVFEQIMAPAPLMRQEGQTDVPG